MGFWHLMFAYVAGLFLLPALITFMGTFSFYGSVVPVEVGALLLGPTVLLALWLLLFKPE